MPKMSETSNYEKTQRKLKCILLSERHHPQNYIPCFQIYDILKKGIVMETIIISIFSRGYREEGGINRQSREEFFKKNLFFKAYLG